MAVTLSAGSGTGTRHGRRVSFEIEMLARWTRVACLLAVLLLVCSSGSCYAADSSASFGFTIHHRFSDAVREIFPAAGDEILPERGTVHYFAAMAERDRIQGRRLAAGSTSSAPLTFVAGNTTYQLAPLGFLYYANVSVGTPGLDFLVALDTGSDLFWLPCDCRSCAIIQTRSGVVPFNTYGLNTSSTGKEVTCASSFCGQSSSCVLPSQCPYESVYLSSNTSSSGYLVEDVLHLTTDTAADSKPVDANIAFGCGQTQTGLFLSGGAPNGLFGLGMGKISVPSVLASKNIINSNSFSMCFNHNGVGRIAFGDKGTSDQAQTPFNTDQSHRRYNISITQVIVGENTSNVEMNAIFDPGSTLPHPHSLSTSTFIQPLRFFARTLTHPLHRRRLFVCCKNTSRQSTRRLQTNQRRQCSPASSPAPPPPPAHPCASTRAPRARPVLRRWRRRLSVLAQQKSRSRCCGLRVPVPRSWRLTRGARRRMWMR